MSAPARRRLRAAAAHLSAAETQEPEPVRLWERVARDPAQFYCLKAAGVAPLRLEAGVEPHRVAEAELARLDAVIAKAVAEQDYLLAAEVHALRQAMDPAAAAAPAPLPGQEDGVGEAAVAAQLAFFAQHGYVRLPNCLQGEQLSRVQAAWRRAQAPVRAEWESQRQQQDPLDSGTWQFFMPETDLFREIAEPAGDPVMLELLDCPPVMALVEQIIGPTARFRGIQALTKVPAPQAKHPERAWHR